MSNYPFEKEHIAKFEGHLIKGGSQDCWIWTKKNLEVHYKKSRISARRFSIKHYLGKETPEGYFVINKCKNKNCVNPNHLLIVTRGERSSFFNSGRKVSKETKLKLKAARNTPESIERNSRKRSPQAIQNMIIAQNKPEVREKIRKALTGRKRTPKEIENIRMSHNKPEVVAKKRKALLGKKRSPKEIENIKKALNRPEVKAKISKALTGRKLDPELIEKIRRAKKAVGEEQPMAKLTDDKVYYIRKYCNSPTDYQELAELFEVDRTTIRRAFKRQTWKHLK